MSNEPGILPEPVPFGKYYLLERISVGGMAEIYKAKAFGVEGFERLLAVKKILSSIAEDESFIEMFIDEAKIAGQLNHPNIAQIFDLGKVDGSYFIALEYISGKDLKNIFERARRVGEEVDIPQVCYVMMKVCEGLGHAHTKKDSQGNDLNIVHRDISPQNILISYEGEVKIIDFGIAKAQGKTSQTQVGVLKGKFSYMSPEQVRGLHVDHRSDIFSLGICLYELLTLERLFLGESDFDTLEKIRKVEMSPPSLYNPNIPKELEDIVLKALAQNPDERYQSTAELAEALERFMRHEDYYYKNKDLAGFMKEAFQEDIEFEKKKLEYYKSLDLQPPDQLGGGEEEPQEDEGLVWDEDEMETQIFDRETDAAAAGFAGASGGGAGGSGARASQANPAVGQSGEHSGVEVVGPDDEVEIVGPDEQANNAPAEGDVEPTIEYNRMSVEEELADLGAEMDGPGGEPEGPSPADEANGRRREPTAKVKSVQTPENTGPHQPPPAARSSSSSSGGDGQRRMLIIGGTATAVIVVALGIVFATQGLFGSKAQIEFTTTPKDVEIFINDQKIHDGKTPYTYQAAPGEAQIVIKKKGYKSFERTTQLDADTTYPLKTTLEKAKVGGELFVKTTPTGATVKVDGEAHDQPSPVTLKGLKPGKHTIEVTKEGFLTASETVEIDKNSEGELDVKLKPAKVALTVESDPESAEYTLYTEEEDEEVASGRTPDTVEDLDAKKTYRVVVEKGGWEDWEETFEPGTSKEETLDAELERRERRQVVRHEPEPEPDPEPQPEPEPEPDPDPPANTGSSSGGGSSGSSSGGSETAEKKPEPTGTGVLNINSRPSARVYIDGKDIGQHTPVLNHEVNAGKHRIQFKNEKFGLNKTIYVDVKPGETETVINKPGN